MLFPTLGGLIASPFPILSSLLGSNEKLDEVIKLFDQMHNLSNKKDYESAVGCLCLDSKGNLYPEYRKMKKDGSIEVSKVGTLSLSPKDLSLGANEMDELLKNGYIVITKYEP